MMRTKVHHVARCIMPDSKAVLMAYDDRDHELLGVVIQTRSVVKWFRTGVTSADRRRMIREVAEHYAA